MEDLQYLKSKDNFIAGTDEVGRGPLAGPVVGCCFILLNPTRKKINDLTKVCQSLGVTDSKKLTHKRRIEILENLKINVMTLKKGQKLNVLSDVIDDLYFSITEISNNKIDQINIHQASLLSMKKSFLKCSESLSYKEGEVLVDGNKLIRVNLENVRESPLIKGDSRSFLIGLSSIVAKEYRDLLMSKLSRKYPGYGLEKHAGYPTQFHRDAILNLGPSKIHRKTFKGVKEHL
ncbi:MAG: ribonuclease HII [Bacteriovoracaceae bacterium]|nr:ribonuclease HII [Bacteriovoracaceae bacterium]